MKIKNYRDLDVWKLSKELARDVYMLTREFPSDERFGFSHQARRAAVFVMSNIAEGSGRRSTQEFIRFINIATGSLCEMESQLLLAIDLQYKDDASVNILLEKANRIGKMLYAPHKALQKPVYANQVPSTQNAARHVL